MDMIEYDKDLGVFLEKYIKDLWGERCKHPHDLFCYTCNAYYYLDNKNWEPLIKKMQENYQLQAELVR